MNLTVYGGTFNPIHLGHLIMAQSVVNQIKTDKFLFIPSFVPPQKSDNIVSFEHRCNMLELSIKDSPVFELSTIESELPGKSYTYYTIKSLYEKYQISQKINFVIGTDALKNFNSWHRPDELSDLIKFIIVKRPGDTNLNEILHGTNLKYIDYEFLKAPLVEISSSKVRELFSANKSIKYMVADQVNDYIIKHELYR